jgi:fluoroacetyl-CoA thioesterase
MVKTVTEPLLQRPAERCSYGVGLRHDAGAGPGGDLPAVALGSGEVPVLATPRVLALAEQATVAAVAGALEAGATTVGTRVQLDHLAPSPVGVEVEVVAVLERVTGRRLEFAMRVSDGGRPVASGLITRVVVDTAAFLRDAAADVGADG